MGHRGRGQIIAGLVVLALWFVNYLVVIHYWDLFYLWRIYSQAYRIVFQHLPGVWGLGEVFLFALLPVGFGLIASGIAMRKGRSFWPWFFVGLFLGIFGVIIALVIKNNAEAKVEAGLKKCPHCSEWVDRSASQCRFCLGALPTSNAGELSESGTVVADSL